MEWILIVVILIFIVLTIFLKNGLSSSSEYPYESQTKLFSPAERSFYGVLSQSIGDEVVLLAKVRVADILKPKKGLSRSEWQKAFNRISSKHFDYVLCSKDTLSIIALIELDDKSHSQKKRIDRDILLDKACESAELNLFRFKAAKSYSTNEIRNILFPDSSIHDNEPSSSIKSFEREKGSSLDQEETLKCPKCSSLLIKRTVNKGKNKGSTFLGCSAFPKCRYVTPDNSKIASLN